jgi:outer membrane protein TolC
VVAVDFDFSRSLSLALEQRPEIQALQKELEQREAELKWAANQTKPRLDLVTQYTLSGLSGKPNSACIDPTTPICVPVGVNVADSVLAGRTQPVDALGSIVSTSPFDHWSAAVRLQVPIGNRSSHARYAEANLRFLETGTNLRALRDQIAEEIRNAIRQAETARRRIDASRETVAFVDDQLAGMRRQFEAGLTSSYDVLQALNELDVARTAELQAVMDFNVGLSKVRLAEASILDTHRIELAEPPRTQFQPVGALR